MAIEKTSSVDLVEVAHNGFVQVRTKTEIKENGEVISSSFHRRSIAPGQDYSAEDDRVKSICAATHTDALIASFKANMPTGV